MEVLSVPKQGNFDMWSRLIDQGMGEFNPLSTSMEQGIGGMHPAINHMHDQSDYLPRQVQQPAHQVINSLGTEQEEQEEHLSKPKRESRVQIRSSSTSRARTVLRIQAPCAGTNLHSRTGSNPLAASMGINPRGLLQSLANEAVAVEKMAQHVLRRMEAEGVNQQVALVLGQEVVLHSGLGSHANSPVGNDQVSYTFHCVF